MTESHEQFPGRRRSVGQKLWPTGLHIAPYLSPSGSLVLIALGRPNFFILATEITELTALDRRNGGGYGAWLLKPHPDRDGRIPFFEHGKPKLWSRGVHMAPWRHMVQCGGKFVKGRPLIAVDRRYRLVAEMMVPDGTDPGCVKRDLEIILELAEGAQNDGAAVARAVVNPWIDRVGAEDDDDFDAADDWKSGRGSATAQIPGPLGAPLGNSLGRGVFVAPWVGAQGETILVALSSARRLIATEVIARGAPAELAGDKLWSLLDREDPE